MNLADEDKQKKRKAMLVILDKCSHEEGSAVSLDYERYVVDLYDRIEGVLRKIANESVFFIRLKAILLIEKGFINEQREFNEMRHMDYYMWSNLFSQNEHDEHYDILDLNNLNELFKSMYVYGQKGLIKILLSIF